MYIVDSHECWRVTRCQYLLHGCKNYFCLFLTPSFPLPAHQCRRCASHNVLLSQTRKIHAQSTCSKGTVESKWFICSELCSSLNRTRKNHAANDWAKQHSISSNQERNNTGTSLWGFLVRRMQECVIYSTQQQSIWGLERECKCLSHACSAVNTYKHPSF